MGSKKETSVVSLARGLNSRYEAMEEKLSELEASGKQLQRKLPEMLSEIENLENTVAEADREIQTLQARRDELRNEYMEASFSGDSETERAIKAERTSVDSSIQDQTSKRETGQTNLTRVKGNLQGTRAQAFETLNGMQIPDEQAFLDALIEAMRKQADSLQRRMHAAGLLYETPEETAAREDAERRAESQREAAEKTAERQRLIERRNFYAKLLSNLNHMRGPRLSYNPWLEYLDGQGIEYRTESSGDSTFIGPNDSGKTVRLDPNSIVADVKRAYVETKRALNEPVDEAELRDSGTRQYRQTASSFVSVMD